MMISEQEILNASILIVDDQQSNVLLLGEMLRDAGYACIASTTDPYAVCEMHRKNRYDLILLDLMMPGMDGAEVLLRKKQEAAIRDIPVIALTALDSPFDQIMWLARTDLQDFIVKSKLPRRELIARIERVLHTRSASDDVG